MNQSVSCPSVPLRFIPVLFRYILGKSPSLLHLLDLYRYIPFLCLVLNAWIYKIIYFALKWFGGPSSMPHKPRKNLRVTPDPGLIQTACGYTLPLSRHVIVGTAFTF